MMAQSVSGGLIIPGSMMLSKEHRDYYDKFVEVFMRNEKNLLTGDFRESLEYDDKLRGIL